MASFVPSRMGTISVLVGCLNVAACGIEGGPAGLDACVCAAEGCVFEQAVTPMATTMASGHTKRFLIAANPFHLFLLRYCTHIVLHLAEKSVASFEG